MQTCNCNPAPSGEAGLTLAIATIPVQPWETPYAPETALKQGTIFPGLDKPFYIVADGCACTPADNCGCIPEVDIIPGAGKAAHSSHTKGGVHHD